VFPPSQMERDLASMIESGQVAQMSATDIQKWQLLARELA